MSAATRVAPRLPWLADSLLSMAWMIAVVFCAAELSVPAIASGVGSGPAEKSLYLRLGGQKGVSSLVSDYVDRLEGDSRLQSDAELKRAVDPLDRKQVKKALSHRLCQVSGGHCSKRQVTITHAPAHWDLKPHEWLAVIDDLNAVLDQHHVRDQERNELLSLLLNNAH